MSADEGTIIHTIAYVIGGTFRWLFQGRGLSYFAFLKEPREIKKNMRYGYLIFFLISRWNIFVLVYRISTGEIALIIKR